MENERITELRDKILKAREEVEHLGKAAEDLRAHLEAERHEGPPDPAVLEAVLQADQQEMDDLQAQIDQSKDIARENKRVLSEIKQNYELLPDEQKPEAWKKIAGEVDCRGAVINEHNAKIDVLETQKLVVLGRMTMVKQKLEAFNAGVFSLPMEEDPRLKWMEEARQTAVERLQGYERELAGLEG